MRAGEALDAAKALAEQICANAPLAVRASRRIVLEATDQPDDVGWKLSGEGMAELFGTEDFCEGLTAFVEKRAPGLEGSLTASSEGGDDAVVVEELRRGPATSGVGHLVERHPASLGGVVAGARAPRRTSR